MQSIMVWCLENPVGRLKDFIGPAKYQFDPCDFAGYLCEDEHWNTMLAAREYIKMGKILREDHVRAVKACNAYTKRTQLWGRFNPPDRLAIDPVRCSTQGSWLQLLGGKSERTKELRSETPMGFSRAFFKANQ